ncbi:MAG TPA: NUDIX domain-containing protein [Candidatus Saccharimonadales bacterium]|nr:NUDIX domain-containing protein [Candidatus Saccharimonadales bacterium]
MKNLLAKIYKALHLPKSMQLFVMRFFQDRFLVGVTGIIFNNKNEILIFKHTYRSQAWALPGGYLKSGEHPQEALEREIKEESGLVVSVDEPLKTRTDRGSARLDMCYTGILIGGDFIPSHEVSEYGFFAQDKLPLLRKNQVFLIDEALRERTS